MQIVTIGGFKGGTGKTTLAALLGVAAVSAGLRTAALDLDLNTRNLSHFLAARRASRLPAPDHVMMLDLEKAGQRRSGGRLSALVDMARLDGYDLLIIDTSSGNSTDVYEAHLVADVVLTPMNESPADLHGLFAPAGSPQAPKINYRELMDSVRFDRRRAGKPVQRWHLCVNRTSAMPTRLGELMTQRIEKAAAEAGLANIWRVRDRVAHRGISQDGRTVLDPSNGRMTMSEVSGRTEVRALLGLLDARGMLSPFMQPANDTGANDADAHPIAA